MSSLLLSILQRQWHATFLHGMSII